MYSSKQPRPYDTMNIPISYIPSPTRPSLAVLKIFASPHVESAVVEIRVGG